METATTSPDPKPEAGHFFRSDHFPFAKRGVPAISFGSGNDLVDGGVEAGKKIEEAYVADRYHQPADEWEAAWTFTGMARDLQMLYTLGSDLANSTRWPNWEPGLRVPRRARCECRRAQVIGSDAMQKRRPLAAFFVPVEFVRSVLLRALHVRITDGVQGFRCMSVISPVATATRK